MKDGCNNMEKNRILRYYDNDMAPEDIAVHMRLTNRIVASILSHYRPGSVEAPEAVVVAEVGKQAEIVPVKKAKPKAKKKPKKKAKATASDEFK